MTEPLLRVVLDVNIFVSAYFFSSKESPPRKVYTAALDKRYRLLHSIDLRADLKRILSRDKFKARLALIDSTVDDLMETISLLGEGVTPAYVPLDSVRDKDDVLILACAVGGKADYIVTGDDDLLTLEEYKGICIVTPPQFLSILFPPTADAVDNPSST